MEKKTWTTLLSNDPDHSDVSGQFKVLAIDLGGTNASFAVVAAGETHFELLSHVVLPSGKQASFADALRTALNRFDEEPGLMAEVSACCISAAGPVVAGRCTPTNLPYTVSTQEIENILKIPCTIMNDFEAICYGVPLLDLNDAKQVRRIQIMQDETNEPESDHGVAAVIGAGTGLGMGYLSWERPELHVFASEGGHLDFAPWDEQSNELATYLRHELGRFPDREHALSGPSIPRLHRFILSSGRAPASNMSQRISRLPQNEQPAAIAAASVESPADPSCKATMDLFFAVYGTRENAGTWN
ncbi:MAG: glucokinase [Spirochaeta sp.]|nr:glucokinase [Spirochaeta sp.]